MTPGIYLIDHLDLCRIEFVKNKLFQADQTRLDADDTRDLANLLFAVVESIKKCPMDTQDSGELRKGGL